jgi:AcrR family transcriptional regulator
VTAIGNTYRPDGLFVTVPANNFHSVSTRRTQEERSAETRLRLLDACVDCLVELGYSNTTTSAIQERAGVSRGALMHHYASKADLMVDSVRHLTEQRGLNLQRIADQLSEDDDRIGQAIALLWESFQGRLFTAAVELWVASRTDAELRQALAASERELRKPMSEVLATLFGPRVAASPRFETAVELTLQFMRGAAFTAILRTDESRQQSAVETWAELFEAFIDEEQT